ncbi:MAG TPA: hypothetical protein VMT80_02315 [Candidatus Paceibacterota bacterium]|nr:hypothetical protein [Candidatus Paceibacterota bacterium]
MKRFISLAVPLLAVMAFLSACAQQSPTSSSLVTQDQVSRAMTETPVPAPAVQTPVIPAFDSTHVFPWKQFGGDPFAKTREEAMAERERAFKALGVPDECIATAMQATSAPGDDKNYLANGMHLVSMMSGGFKVYRNVEVQFPRPPIKGKNGMYYAAKVEVWTFPCDGAMIRIGLPEVCNNWSLFELVAPPVPFANGVCPDGYTLAFMAWDLNTIPASLRASATEAVQTAQSRNTEKATDPNGYRGSDFSRSVGGPLRQSGTKPYPYAGAVEVNLRDPKTAAFLRNAGTMQVFAGQGEMVLPVDPHLYIIELVVPDQFVTVLVSGGKRRIWDFPDEWDQPQVKKYCRQYTHGGGYFTSPAS